MWCLSVARCATRFVWCARTFSRLNLGRARDLHHSLAIDRIHPRSGTTSLRTDTQLALSAIQDILVLVQNHIGTERQPAERAIAHASDGRRIGDANRLCLAKRPYIGPLGRCGRARSTMVCPQYLSLGFRHATSRRRNRVPHSRAAPGVRYRECQCTRSFGERESSSYTIWVYMKF